MISYSNILIVLLLCFIALYTVSYGWWTWKRRNRLGAFMVFALALSILALPIYSLFIRE
ncbi:MAG: hypothetical protein N2645_18180 [Clostridia bacterium]|nr:hypothetical protein [Clostridia bacterium]